MSTCILRSALGGAINLFVHGTGMLPTVLLAAYLDPHSVIYGASIYCSAVANLSVLLGLYAWLVHQYGGLPGEFAINRRIRDKAGQVPSFWRALLRAIGLWLCYLSLGAGFLPKLAGRAALHEWLSETGTAAPDRVH